MKTVEPTLRDRTGRVYRQLLILQRLFQPLRDDDIVEWPATGDRSRDTTLWSAIAETIDELVEHVRVLSTVPFPLNEWREGDGPDDERWRPLTEVERRDILSIVEGYESLISWVEGLTNGSGEAAWRPLPSDNGHGTQLWVRSLQPPPQLRESANYLKAERSRVARFREDMAFLERGRASAET